MVTLFVKPSLVWERRQVRGFLLLKSDMHCEISYYASRVQPQDAVSDAPLPPNYHLSVSVNPFLPIVFVLATLHQLNPSTEEETPNVQVLVLCHTRELAFQIAHEYERFSKYLPSIKTAVFYGGVNIKQNREILKNEHPHIVVGTPGRILALCKEKTLVLSSIKHFVLDECDRVLEALDMRRDVHEIFTMTPNEKQV